MSEYVIDQDQRRCICCRACEVHCKTEKDLPVGPRFCEIVEIGPKVVGGAPRMHFQFMPCFHCEQAWCVAACPTGAMRKRQSDGIVWVEQEACIGCKACLTACAWGVPQWNAATGKVFKCDYCKDRIDAGLEPACVTGCVTGSLRWVKPAEVTERKRRSTAREMVEPFRY